MSDRFVNMANDNMGAIESLLKGLPGISGYVDKDLRRDADKRARLLIAARLDEEKQELFDVQRKLSQSGGLKYMDDVDRIIQKLQTLIDRIKTASYGYAGLFDPVKVREDELNALHRFDVAMAAHTVELEAGIQALAEAVLSGGDVMGEVDKLTDLVAELNRLYSRRGEAIVSPELLLEPSYAPEVDQSLLEE